MHILEKKFFTKIMILYFSPNLTYISLLYSGDLKKSWDRMWMIWSNVDVAVCPDCEGGDGWGPGGEGGGAGVERDRGQPCE